MTGSVRWHQLVRESKIARAIALLVVAVLAVQALLGMAGWDGPMGRAGADAGPVAGGTRQDMDLRAEYISIGNENPDDKYSPGYELGITASFWNSMKLNPPKEAAYWSCSPPTIFSSSRSMR